MAKRLSRPQRWTQASNRLSAAASSIETAVEEYNAALEELRDLQSEYQEWFDNLPENLQGGALSDKLETVTQIDLEDLELDLDAVGEVENADLPRGFGRD